MVILKLNKNISDAFECEVTDSNEDKKYNLIRPCERYQELYESCSSFRARIHQYYVYGETNDCEPMRENFKNCLEYRRTKDITFLDSIRKWEQDLINVRLQTVKQNNTWKLRETPPANFSSSLPDFIVKRMPAHERQYYQGAGGDDTSSIFE